MSIREITPEDALARCRDGAVLIDVREAHERALGMADGALGVAMGELIANPSVYLPAQGAEVLLICQGGLRSLRTAEALAAQGFGGLCSVDGGTTRWIAESLPTVMPAGELDADFAERYSRHLRLPQVGVDGQRRLEAARVLMIGAGGLGSPAAYYLAAAGIGHLRIADDDVVDRSNLQRQILHADDRIGERKTASAARTLSALNPRVDVREHGLRLTSANVEEVFEGYDVVVDGSDNFATRYLVNDACVKLGLPNVHGSIYRFEGQVSVFWPRYPKRRGPCYRCLYAEPPPPEFAPSCAEAGVLGVLPGVIGTLEAIETIKILLGLGDPLVGRLLAYDALAQRFSEFKLAPRADCAWCAPGATFPGYVDYEAFCAGPAGAAR
jgi:molybdopterin/thiamine biosynthesis adenylyltransferase/rhodanese-related sulfurtransferase